MLQNDVIKCCKMMSSNVALLHSNNCCVLEPAICEDLDLHVVIFYVLPLIPLFLTSVDVCSGFKKKSGCVLCHMCAIDTFECCTC